MDDEGLAPRSNRPPHGARKVRTRTIQPGPRCTLMVWWVLIDVAIVAAASFFGLEQIRQGRLGMGYALVGIAGVLFLLDVWRLLFLNRVRRLVAYGRIEQADVVALGSTRLSLRPRADAPSPIGGWPIVPACKVTYQYKPGGREVARGAFLVATDQSGMFAPGEDIEVFVDPRNPSKLIPSLVARWYFRVSSRMIGAADDPAWDFTNPPPEKRGDPPKTA